MPRTHVTQPRLRYRIAGPPDAGRVAALQTKSWRRTYRGIFTDAYLDGDLYGELAKIWRRRFADNDQRRHTVVAEVGRDLVGVAHTVVDDDLTWGSLLDNLHVAADYKRYGIGSHLMAHSARTVLELASKPGLHLWVNQQNPDARAFYAARGGTHVETRPSTPPGGVPARLLGSPTALRIVWPDAHVLLTTTSRPESQ